MQYEKLYAEMVGAAEQAIEAMEHGTEQATACHTCCR